MVEKELKIKTEPIDEAQKNSTDTVKSSAKRKQSELQDNEELGGNIITLLSGISAGEDGSVIKTKKKQKIMTEEKKLKLDQEKVNSIQTFFYILI